MSSGHRLECVEWVKGTKKVIRFWCQAKGCDTRGRIWAVPASTADGIFEQARRFHAEDPGGEAGSPYSDSGGVK